MKKKVKVLSVRGWWAHCIIHGVFDMNTKSNDNAIPNGPGCWDIVHKDVENRSWWRRYRGRLYIHMSGKPGRGSECQDDNFDSYLLKKGMTLNHLYHPPMFGHIIGHVNLVDINQTSTSMWYQGNEVNKKMNYAWCLEDPTPIEPIKVPGSQGIWNYELEEES
jgi:hypothetical protein